MTSKLTLTLASSRGHWVPGVLLPYMDMIAVIRTAVTARWSFDEELKLYKLLDLDAEGEEDADVDIDDSTGKLLVG